MSTIILEGAVNNTMLETLIEGLRDEGNIDIFINSSGGITSYADIITQLINNNASRITLYANNFIASSAFNIFFGVKCKRIVQEGTSGMAHMSRIDTSVSGKGRIQNVSKWQIKQMMFYAKKQAKKMKKMGVSDKKIKLFLNEYDIYFTEHKLKKMVLAQQREVNE